MIKKPLLFICLIFYSQTVLSFDTTANQAYLVDVQSGEVLYEKNKDQTLRVFPISNWTEFDIWNYIKQENIEIVDLYFAKKRKCIKKNNAYFMIDDNRYKIQKGEKIITETIRFRTLGCYPLTAGIKSSASNLSQVINETLKEKNSERSGRLIDLDKPNSMELKKREGYF